jgi:hypothetical protein
VAVDDCAERAVRAPVFGGEHGSVLTRLRITASVHLDDKVVRVRTTIDLPEDLHQQALSIARDTSRTLSETVAELIRRGLGEGKLTPASRSPKTGLPVVSLGKVITTDDVRSLEDDQ